MYLLRGLLFNFGYALSVVFYGGIITPIVWFMPFRKRCAVLYTWMVFMAWWLRITCNIRYTLEGKENIPDEACVVVANHQSSWETFFLQPHFYPQSVAIKKELFYIPFMGFIMRACKPIIIDRNKKQNALKQLLQQGKERINEDINVLIFPEGTRVKVGERKKHFAGGSMVAIQSGAPILPIVHNAALFWPKGKIKKYPGIITVKIAKAIPTEGRSAKELTKEIQDWMYEEMNKLNT